MILSGYLAKHLVTADLPFTFSTRTTPVGVASAAVAGPPSATASNSIPQGEALSDESTQNIEVWAVEEQLCSEPEVWAIATNRPAQVASFRLVFSLFFNSFFYFHIFENILNTYCFKT